VSGIGGELHCHSAYSFGDGASTPDELALAAAKRGYRFLALTDHDNLCGAMEFAHACKAAGVKPISGCELTVASADGAIGHLTLLAATAKGWSNLCRAVTEAHASGSSPPVAGRTDGPVIALDRLGNLAEGLVCLSGCAGQGLLCESWHTDGGSAGAGLRRARQLCEVFGRDRLWVEIQRPFHRDDRARNRWLSAIASQIGVRCVATGNAHAHDSSRWQLQEVLVAAHAGRTLAGSESLRRGNSMIGLCTQAETRARFAGYEAEVDEMSAVAERIEFDLTSDLGYRYPGSDDPSADLRLASLCRDRLDERYPSGPSRDQAADRLATELDLISSLGLSGFFCLHREILELAREVAVEVRGPSAARSLLPPGRGRGSSVSSIVCYLTGLSHVDPISNGLTLGRFLNEDLSAVPDIDLDFPRDIRHRLIPRVQESYGAERSALVSTFVTYRSKSATRDLARALSLPPAEVEVVCKSVGSYSDPERSAARMREALGRERFDSPGWATVRRLAPEMLGLPRHISQHPGGMVVSTEPLIGMCPSQPAAMEGRRILQWDKDSCSDAGFLKIDLLGLGMLSAVERCVDEIERTRSERVDLSRIPHDDPLTWDAIRRADTLGVFQIESRAQIQMLRRTQPQDLEELAIQVALVRPGPIKGGAVHPYVERRARQRIDPAYQPPYDHPLLEPVLAETLGVIVFQDQVLGVAQALAGFSVEEAEGLRRAMSRKRSHQALLDYRERFLAGAESRGVPAETAERVFGQIEGFSGFGFPKSHSVAFGLLAYQSTWLRTHYGSEFLCALLNEQPMGFYPPDALVHEAQHRGVDVLPADVNFSAVESRVETSGAESGPDGLPPVRLGLACVSGLAREDASAAVEVRQGEGAYRGLADLAARSGVSPAGLRRLAWAGACDSLFGSGLSSSRRPALWQAGAVAVASRSGDATQLAIGSGGETDTPALPAQSRWEEVQSAYETTGISLGEHPIGVLRESLPANWSDSKRITRIRQGRPVTCAGLVVAKQRPATANGMVFVLLEDEHDLFNAVLTPPVAEEHSLTLRLSRLLRVDGRVERRGGTTSILVSRISPLRADPEGEDKPDSPYPGGVVTSIGATSYTVRDQERQELDSPRR